MEAAARIVVAGAGSIGCFVGGMLAAGGRDVTLLCRPRIADELSAGGLRLTDLGGGSTRLDPDALKLATGPSALRAADLVLVTVKSGATAEMADHIAAHCAPGTLVLSLQNGISNVRVLRAALPNMTVLGGIVEYNVLHKGGGHFHRGTSGRIVIEAGRDDVLTLMRAPGLEIAAASDIASVQWGKLLVNLNNALNALSGLPLRTQLQQREWRRLLADQTEEALRVVSAAWIKPAPSPVPPRYVPAILRLPDALFRLVAARMLQVDPEARSSMWEDLKRGRKTEIDYLQGEIIALGQRHGVGTPLCAAIAGLVRRAEEAGAGSPELTPQQVRAAAS
jgi:2-dehydropantoate 2-reductase